MELKRYNLEELKILGRELFYDYMSSEDELFWFDYKFEKLEKGRTPALQIHENNCKLLISNENRINVFKEALESPTVDPSCKETLKKELEFLKIENRYIKESNMKNQKELYRKTESTDYCRSAVRIPLNKKLNSFYDDLILEVIYYDDVSTLNGKINKYKELKTKEERYHFIRENTEITHMGFAYIKNNRHVYTSGIMGKLNTEDPRIPISSFKLFQHKFSDFENLTLAEISTITNNDIKQFLQSKIDLDKENLVELASVNIRGDIYKIYNEPKTNKFFIRYVCRSTGRIYYNSLNLHNLALSHEFKEKDFESYARAWWNLNTLGSSTEGKPVIRL